MGVVEANVFWYGDAIMRDISAYLLLFVMMIFRPGEIIGRSIFLLHWVAQLRVQLEIKLERDSDNLH